MNDITNGILALALLGDETRAVSNELAGLVAQPGQLFPQAIVEQDSDEWRALAMAFGEWDDHEAAAVLRHFLDRLGDGTAPRIEDLTRWVLNHPNESGLVVECMELLPPEGITINKVLSGAGSQKLVFHGTWLLTLKQVVVKRFRGSAEAAAPLLDRESHSHPLSIDHPNIIETHLLRNAQGEIHLVEEYLPYVLSDRWRAPGVEEAANLLYQVASGLQHLHEGLNWVHGDIKPDNIGLKNNSYIILDFGICRPANEFTPEVTGTGSLRTRAPELLERDSYTGDPYKTDVWALGATVFNALVGRYPLFNKDEPTPRVWDQPARDNFEDELARRAREEWHARVDLELVHPSLRPLLTSAMALDPSQRCTARELRERAEHELAAFLRMGYGEGGFRFAPVEELRQLSAYLPGDGALAMMPIGRKQALKQRLGELADVPGLSAEDRVVARELLARIA